MSKRKRDWKQVLADEVESKNPKTQKSTQNQIDPNPRAFFTPKIIDMSLV